MKPAVLLLTLLALTATGCASVYTGMQREADGSYSLTKTSAGLVSTHGTLYHCQVVSPQSMRCAEVDAP